MSPCRLDNRLGKDREAPDLCPVNPDANATANRRPVILGLGEVLWDLLPAGRQLGGAPANFAYHAAALGADARLVSRVGPDELGHETLERLGRLGLRIEAVERDPLLPTGTVSVVLTADGQPRFTIHEPVAWDALQGSPAAREAVAQADALCFGTLGQRHETARTTIRALIGHLPPSALRVLDVNLRQHFFSPRLLEESLGLAQVAKVNDSELAHLGEIFDLPGDPRSQISRLADRFRLRCVVCTRGAQGSLILADGRWSELAGTPARVVDTIGAGDAFTAALTLGLLAGWPLEVVHRRAADLATHVCTQPGAMPPLPAELTAPFRSRWPHP
jgi:fructokinase